MRKYTAAELPLTTSNAALAFSLYIAGTPFIDPESPLVNIYDAEILRNMGYHGDIEKAATKAFHQRQKGHVEYALQKTHGMGRAMDGFEAAEKSVESSAKSGAVLIAEIIERHAGGLATREEAMSYAVCIMVKRWREELKDWEMVREFNIQRNLNEVKNADAAKLAAKVFLIGEPYAFMAVCYDARQAFLALAFNYPPMIRLRHPGATRENGERRYIVPGFATYSANADNEIRRGIGVPAK